MARGEIRVTTITALSCAMLLLAGCIKVKDHVTVDESGSGSYVEAIQMDMAAMKQVKEIVAKMMKEMGAPPEKPEEEPKDDPLADMKAGWKNIPGLEVTKATSEEKDGKLHLHVEAKFATLEAYAKASGLETGAELVRNENESYTLKFDADYGAGDMPKPEPGAAKPAEDPAQAAFEKALAGLEFTRSLTLPGKIVETNGTKSEDGSTVTWKVTLDDIKKGKKDPHTVTFEGEDLDLEPFKVERKPKEMGMGGPPGGEMPK